MAAGETTCSTAKNADEIDDVIRNTFIQGTLSIIFAVLVARSCSSPEW